MEPSVKENLDNLLREVTALHHRWLNGQKGGIDRSLYVKLDTMIRGIFKGLKMTPKTPKAGEQ